MNEPNVNLAFEENEAVIDKANFQIAHEITQLDVPKGKVYFFDADDKVIWEIGKRDCADTIEIPKGTKKIVADGNLNITGGKNPNYLSIFVDGNITGRGLNLGRYTAVRATGSVDLVNNNPESDILVMNSGDVTLNGSFRTASANTKGNVVSDSKEVAFFEVTTEKNLSIKRRFTGNVIFAGGKSELPKDEEAEQNKKAGKHSAKIAAKSTITKKSNTPKETPKPPAAQSEPKKWQDTVKPESNITKTGDNTLTSEEVLRKESAAFAKSATLSTKVLKQETPPPKKKDWRGKIDGELPSEIIVEETASTIVKLLPSAHEAAKQMATALGMSASNYVESLLTGSIKKNPDLIKKGGDLIQRFDGSQTAARNYAIREELERLRDQYNNGSTVKHSVIQKPEPKFRVARFGEKTSSILVKPLKRLYGDANKLATANLMSLPKYLESLIIDSLNQNPDLIREGICEIEQANGSLHGARCHVLEQQSEESRKLQQSRSR